MHDKIIFTQNCFFSAPIESPIDVSSSIQVPESEMPPISPQSPDQKGGLFGWFSGNKMISKVVEKTKVCNCGVLETVNLKM